MERQMEDYGYENYEAANSVPTNVQVLNAEHFNEFCNARKLLRKPDNHKWKKLAKAIKVMETNNYARIVAASYGFSIDYTPHGLVFENERMRQKLASKSRKAQEKKVVDRQIKK